MKKVIIHNWENAEKSYDAFSIKLTGEHMTVSDGYHTFEELYEHRVALFIALCRVIQQKTGQDITWRSLKHAAPDKDGKELPMYDGWYVMGIRKEDGKQISYHLPISTWEDTNFAETLEHAPDFDGHTPQDVLARLKTL